MSTPFFYLPPEAWGNEACLCGQEAHHAGQVLRLSPGCEINLLDGRGRTGRFVIRRIAKSGIHLECLHTKALPRPAARAVMALAFSKAIRRGFFLEKAVELGAYAIWFWQADHSQGKAAQGMLDACRRRMIAGAKQCGNPWFPEVNIISSGVDGLLENSLDADYRILPWELQETGSMLTPEIAGRAGTTIYAIGPEGGFSQQELQRMETSGFVKVSLGSRILRCETAATLCLGIHWWASHLPGHDAGNGRNACL